MDRHVDYESSYVLTATKNEKVIHVLNSSGRHAERKKYIKTATEDTTSSDVKNR